MPPTVQESIYESQLGGGNLFEEKCICTIKCVTTSLLLSIFSLAAIPPCLTNQRTTDVTIFTHIIRYDTRAIFTKDTFVMK